MNRTTIRFSLAALAAALLLGVPASAGDSTRFAIEEDEVLIGFSAGLGAHKQISGLAHTLEGSVQMAATGGQIKLRLPISAISSGSSLVDSALRSALDSQQFPAIELDATSNPAGGDNATLRLSGTLRAHGATIPLAVPVKVSRDGRLAFVHAEFPVSLTALGVSRPTVLGAQVGDQVDVTVDARLHSLPEGQAVASF